MTATRRTGVALALATAVISGFSVFVNAYGVRTFPDATTYTTAKNLVAALVLVGLVAFAPGRSIGLTRPHGRRQWLGLAVIGTLGGSIPFVLFFEGLSRGSSAQTAVLHKTLVLWVAVLAITLLRERLHWAHWLAVALLLVGQAGLGGGFPRLGSAELMVLAATLMWAVEVVIAKGLLASLSSWTIGVARMGLGSIVLLGWLLVRGDLGGLVRLTATQLGWALLTGVLLAAYVGTWFAALQRAQAVDVTAVLVLAVPITSALDVAVRGAAVGPQAGWLVLVLLGGALAAVLGWRAQPAPVIAGA